MRRDPAAIALAAVGLTLWAALIAAPLVYLYASPSAPTPGPAPAGATPPPRTHP